MSDGSEPVADHEILYRRIPATSGFYDPHVDPNPSPLAFRPTQLDTTGLSLSRAKYKTLEQAGQGREGKPYFVAVLRAGELRRLGMEIVPRPLDDDPGHFAFPFRGAGLGGTVVASPCQGNLSHGLFFIQWKDIWMVKAYRFRSRPLGCPSCRKKISEKDRSFA
jgi:hypothetical protein